MITSSSNPRVKEVIALNTKSRERRARGLFPAEGLKLFREAPAHWREQVYVSASFAQSQGELLEGVPAEVVEDRVFARMCDTKTPQGILTLLRIPVYEREALLGDGAPLVLLLEDLQDPGNVGTIFRTAEAAGVTGIFLSRKTADLFAPKTIRSTMGAIYRMPFQYAENLTEAAQWLKSRGVCLFAAHLNGSAWYHQADYREGTGFLIGNEGNGLSDALAETADTRIKIPMEGQVESLNAAVAASVLMYTAHLQRHVQRV